MSSATLFPSSGEVLHRVERARTATGVQRRYLVEPAPWTRRNLLISAALMTAGGIGMVIGWYGISREVSFRQQTGWLVLSIFGTVVIALGLSTTLIAAFRSVRRGQRQIAADFRAHFALAPRRDAQGSEAVGKHVATDSRVILPGLKRVHVPSCPMVEGKTVVPLEAAGLQDPDLRHCGVCLP